MYHDYMGILSLFSVAVFAAETILSPVPESVLLPPPPPPTKPSMSFGALPTPSPTPTPIPVILGASIEKPSTRTTRKPNVTIAVIGDSMVDTLGPGVPHLATAMRKIYPATAFTIYNHGVGAENIDSSFSRVTSGYSYLGEARPSLASQQPDVVVVESFGYNPYSFDEGALEKHWLAMATLVDILRTYIPDVKIVIAATIAPNWDVFGDGAAGLSFDPEGKRQKVSTIRKYLDNAVKFAQSQNLPLADAFHPSLTADGNGKLQYINGGDHIHYSDAGRELFAQKVTQAIVGSRLLEL